MYLTYEEYQTLGYTKVELANFARFEAMAEVFVRRITLNRISDDDLRPVSADPEIERIAIMNQRGICEIVDLYYQVAKNAGDDGKRVRSFSNGKYSETYEAASIDTSIKQVVLDYFTADQLWRGVR